VALIVLGESHNRQEISTTTVKGTTITQYIQKLWENCHPSSVKEKKVVLNSALR
jgi:hypothetical protein